jgi:CO/xanthine dehydrogenase Mo-binding subunit
VYATPAGGGFIQLTGASTSMEGYWARYRMVAAQARARLVAAAALAWQVPAAEIEISAGVLSHPSGQRAGFGELATSAEQLPVPDHVQPMDPSRYKLIGREGRIRVDTAGKILGTTRYTIDVTLPSMLTAVVLHPPKFGATPAKIDGSATLAERGVTAVFPIEEGIAVVGVTFDDAQRGLRALKVDWDDQHAERRSSEELLAEHRRLLESGEDAVAAREEGDVAGALSAAAHVVDAIYELPYLAHTPMEPNNAVCRMGEDGVLEVWSATEGPEYVRMAASAAAGIDKDRVRVHVPYGRVLRPAQQLRPRSGQRGRAGREGAELEVPGEAPVAAGGRGQERPVPGDGGAPGAGRRRRRRPADRVPPPDRRTADLGQPSVRVRRPVQQGRRLHDDKWRGQRSLCGAELQVGDHQRAGRRSDHGVAVGGQLAHRIRAGVGDRRARGRHRA